VQHQTEKTRVPTIEERCIFALSIEIIASIEAMRMSSSERSSFPATEWT